MIGKSLTEIKYKMFEIMANKTILVGRSSKTSKPTAKIVSIFENLSEKFSLVYLQNSAII